jgi:DNA-binding PadR family transcriptional regulator
MGKEPENHWAFGGRRFSPWRQGNDTFNPLVAGMMSKGGGLLPLIVLNLLHEQPRYGNEIMELITERTNGQWVANPGAIYPLISVLEEHDLVVGEWEDPVKRTVRIYELTETGSAELVRMKAIIQPKIEEAIDVLDQLVIDLNGDSDNEKPTIV